MFGSGWAFFSYIFFLNNNKVFFYYVKSIRAKARSCCTLASSSLKTVPHLVYWDYLRYNVGTVDEAYYDMSREQYVNRLSHEGIRELIRSVSGDRQGILMMLFAIGFLVNGDGGFSEGGSLTFVV